MIYSINKSIIGGVKTNCVKYQEDIGGVKNQEEALAVQFKIRYNYHDDFII